MKKTFFKLFCLIFACVLTFNAAAGSGYEAPSDIQQTFSDSLSAYAYCLTEVDTGDIVIQSNADVKLPMASTTKIMTAIVAIENAPLQQVITVSSDACGIEGSSIYLAKNERLTIEELLYALMLESANDAACALAIEIGKTVDGFVEMMNGKAAELGLENTHFTDPHGLGSAEHYTSAYDLCRLMSYCMKNETFAKITSTKRMSLKGADDSYSRLLINHNKLLGTFDGIQGGKTGYTKASGRCLVTFCNRDGVELCAVTLNAPDDWSDHRAMYEYGFTLYKNVILESPGQYEYSSAVCGGTQSSIQLDLKRRLTSTLRADHGEISRVVYMQRFYYSGIEEGDILGSVNYFCNGKLIASAPLYARHSVEKAKTKHGFFAKLRDIMI